MVRWAGTSKAYCSFRLERDAPELYARVLAGEMSVHAAAVQAGITLPRFTVIVKTPAGVAGTLRKQLPPDMLAEVVRLLAA